MLTDKTRTRFNKDTPKQLFQNEANAKNTITPAGMKPGLAARGTTSFSVAHAISGYPSGRVGSVFGRQRLRSPQHLMHQSFTNEGRSNRAESINTLGCHMASHPCHTPGCDTKTAGNRAETVEQRGRHGCHGSSRTYRGCARIHACTSRTIDESGPETPMTPPLEGRVTGATPRFSVTPGGVTAYDGGVTAW